MEIGKPERRKQYHPKVHSGCLTCKRRRVKCGEEKPECIRCQRVNIKCGGYRPRQMKLFEPQGQHDRERYQTRTSVVPAISRRYGQPDEVRALDFWLRRTAPMLSMSGPAKELWTIVVPQASHNHSPVKHMLVALSMLDQYLTGSLPSLSVEGQFRPALQQYNMAIGALDITSPGFSLACTILVSMLAWMFETITNRPLASAMHLQAARLMSSRSFSHTPNSEDLFVIGCVERLVQDNGLSYAHGLRRPERQLVQIKSLDEARIRLIDLAQPLLRNPTVDDCLITATRRGLDEWRADFEIYRYTGAETLRAKRSVFLAHNMVGTYLDMLSPVVPEETPISPIGQRILDDIEHILDHEELDDIEWILSLIVGHMIDHTEAESEIHCRAQRLKTSSDDLHTRINRRQTQYASSVY